MAIKMIVTDPAKLVLSSEEMELDEISASNPVLKDLLDTARHHREKCYGIAANQIGYFKRVFALKTKNDFILIINPAIILKTGGIKRDYESCLSRPGEDPVKVRRFKEIKFRFFDTNKTLRQERFKKLAARVVQHEMDHLNGVFI